MYDATIHAKTLARQFKETDFSRGLLYVPLSDKEAALERAVQIAASGFPHISLYRGSRGGKHVYQHSSVEQALIVRHISSHIRQVTGVRQSDRQDIVRCMISLLSQGIVYKAIKLDIKSFYETVDTDFIAQSLRGDSAFSRQSVNLLESFFDALRRQSISGLPRGLAISATLAEYVMRDFDSRLEKYKGVRFYSRFVDDVILIVDQNVNVETLIAYAQSALPSGLNLSRVKSKSYNFSSQIARDSSSPDLTINFLGYQLDVNKMCRDGSSIQRRVSVDIAKSKVNKYKRRIVKSFLEFNNDANFSVLMGRVKMLTCNHSFIDENSGQKRFVGLRYNYPLVDSAKSESIKELDNFFRNAIYNTHPNNRIKPSLSSIQKRQILGFSFKKGFEDNIFFTFSSRDIMIISRCWAHA
ncbi:antiviral reverse transcriptase Drt3a [Sphingomonas sanguinis]|uniref:antiviral reverse transcriptase Drt3a n=1 Tax=Sphingomonas sanguinis TaxID=33051 RepID=UPI000B2F29BD|nr:antiviral reverse transcriptase Drt3a [Sphingomonas sanguinis]